MATRASASNSRILPELLQTTLKDLEALPNEIHSKLEEMSAVDATIADNNTEVQTLSVKFIESVSSVCKTARVRNRKNIRRLHEKSCNMAEKKVAIARKLSEAVDEHIQRLDVSLAKYEEEFHKYLANPVKRIKVMESAETVSRLSLRRKQKTSAEASVSPRSREPILLTHSILKHALPGSDESGNNKPAWQPRHPFDMPLDPHEPTYCICHNVSYGEMIGCDNPDCMIEWFHFSCVGLDEQPEGEWYCPRCSGVPKETSKTQEEIKSKKRKR